MSATISINGAAPVSCESLGWSFDSLSRRNCAPDVASLKRVGTHGTALDIAAGAQVVLFLDGVRTFTGTAQAAQYALTEAGSRVTLPVFGPWWHLMQMTYCRAELRVEGAGFSNLPPQVGTTFTTPSGSGAGTSVWDGSGWVSGGAGTTYKWARARNLAASPKELDIADFTGARGLIFDPDWTASPIYRTVYAEVSALLTYQLTMHSRLGLPAPFQVDLVALEADLGSNASPRFRTFMDQKVATVLTTMLAIKPDAAVWFDYSTEIPTLRIKVAAVETVRALEPGAAPLQRITIAPRPELKPAGIVIRWEDQAESPFGVNTALYRGYRRPYHLDKYPLTCLPHDPGIVTHTLDYEADISTFKPQLAQSLYESLSTLRATGSMTLSFDSAADAAAMRPGLAYQLTGDADLATAQILTQDTTWNIATGQVDCALGYPRALDLQSLNDLKGWLTWSCQGVFSNTTVLVPAPP